MNICVKHGLKALSKPEKPEEPVQAPSTSLSTLSHTLSSPDAIDEVEYDQDLVSDHPDDAAHGNLALQANPAYAEALARDPVKIARQLVAVCHASGQRREELKQVIVQGNREGHFPEPLPEVQLLRDVDTRWSSTFMMIDRVLTLYPVRILDDTL